MTKQGFARCFPDAVSCQVITRQDWSMSIGSDRIMAVCWMSSRSLFGLSVFVTPGTRCYSGKSARMLLGLDLDKNIFSEL